MLSRLRTKRPSFDLDGWILNDCSIPLNINGEGSRGDFLLILDFGILGTRRA